MASIRRMTLKNGKIRYYVRIRRKGFPLACETFSSLKAAEQWGRKQDEKIDRLQKRG